MNDARSFDILEQYVRSRRAELELKMSKQKLKRIDRYRERLIQHIEELERQIIREKLKNNL